MRLFWFYFLLVSFWPWEQDPDQIKKSSFELSRPPRLMKTLRVALFYEKPEVKMSIPAPYEIESLPANESLEEGPSLPSVSIRSAPEGIRVGKTLYRVPGVRIRSKAQEVGVDGQKYRSAVQVLKNPAGSLTVVNEIDVEDYLKGVLPVEVDPTWPAEALKAQAVVSRTYAIFKNIENKDFPFTLSADVGSQVYKGKDVEHASSSQAVDETRGEILAYRGKIFPAFFHSTCGGWTTRSDYQWKIDSHPSLKGVECPFCRGAKYYSWQAEFSASDIQRHLARKGKVTSDIQNIKPEEVDSSGRPRYFKIEHKAGAVKISANEFRRALGVDQMRSTKVKVEKVGDRFLFKGRGWGHGVGLCQWGAKRMAELGYRYRDILRYYYPDSEIRNLNYLTDRDSARLAPSGGDPEGGNIFKRWFGKIQAYVEDF